MRSFASLTLLLAGTAQAHFLLNYPPPLGPFLDDEESSSQCGGYTPDVKTQNITTFHADGDAVALTSTHPSITYLYRITDDLTATSGWTQLLMIEQTGLGAFCEPSVAIPSKYVGKQAVLSVIADSPDGVLYQCALINVTSGTGSAPSSCTNASAVTAAVATDATLTAVLDGSSSSNSTNSSSSTHNAAAGSYGEVKGWASLGSIAIITALSAALLF